MIQNIFAFVSRSSIRIAKNQEMLAAAATIQMTNGFAKPKRVRVSQDAIHPAEINNVNRQTGALRAETGLFLIPRRESSSAAVFSSARFLFPINLKAYSKKENISQKSHKTGLLKFKSCIVISCLCLILRQ